MFSVYVDVWFKTSFITVIYYDKNIFWRSGLLDQILRNQIVNSNVTGFVLMNALVVLLLLLSTSQFWYAFLLVINILQLMIKPGLPLLCTVCVYSSNLFPIALCICYCPDLSKAVKAVR